MTSIEPIDKGLVKYLTAILQIAAIVWAAATLSSKVTHLDESVHVLNGSMVKVFEQLNDEKVRAAAVDVRLDHLEKRRP